MIVIKFLKKIHQAICLTTHHSLPSFPLHLACLPVDLSWNINYVDKLIWYLSDQPKVPEGHYTEGILSPNLDVFRQFALE